MALSPLALLVKVGFKRSVMRGASSGSSKRRVTAEKEQATRDAQTDCRLH